MRWLSWVVLIFIVVVIAIIAVPDIVRLNAGGSEASSQAAWKVTKAQYDGLRTGMDPQQVKAVMGGGGEEMSSSDIANIHTTMISYKNWNGSNMILMFQNDRLISKTQLNLP